MSSLRPTPTSRHLHGAASLITVVLVLAACQSSASGSPEESAGASEHVMSQAPSEAASTAPSEGPQSGEITVTIAGNSFGPDLTITAGSSIVFVNNDSVGHTVTHGTDGTPEANAAFDVAVADGETTDPILFDTPGTYNVTCKIHPNMSLIITVV
jgi:plastocyanin